MSLTGAQRTKNWRQRLLDSCLTEPEKTAVRSKWNKQSNDSKKRKRAKKRKDAESELKPLPTANTLRQRRFRQKRKEEKEREQATTEAPSEVIAEETIANLHWKNAYTQIPGDEPVYKAGRLIECPDELQGENAMAAMMLLGFSHYLQENWDSEEVMEVLQLAKTGTNAKITGVREISGNRYEFYIRVEDCTPAAFCRILRYSEKMRRNDLNLLLDEEEMVKLVGMIIAFAKERARLMLDERYELQNFTLIVSHGKVPRQDIHIDVCKEDQYQLGMLCSPRGELTSEYQCGNDEIVEKGENLTRLWTDLPPSIQKKLNRFPIVQELLDGFGPLLFPTIKKTGDEGDMPTTVPFGSMLCLPGRVMHCGPEVSEENMLRAVLFFTATPKENTAITYNSDTQYCRTTIIHDILFYIWPSLSPTEKEYMLRKWIKVGLCIDSIGAIQGNMQHKHLKVIALALRKLAMTKKMRPESMDKLISKIVMDKIWTGKKGVHYWGDLSSVAYKITKK